jgi:hypothetical protein
LHAGFDRPLIPWSRYRAARFMQGDHGASGVKFRCLRGWAWARFCHQPFQNFTAGPGRLALWGSARYISVEFPDKTSAAVLFAHAKCWRVSRKFQGSRGQ